LNTDYDTTKNSHLIPLELSEELKKEEIVNKFVKDTRTNSLVLSLNHKYKQKTLVFPIPTAKKIDWAAITEKFAKKLRACEISLEHKLMLEDVMQVNCEIVVGLADNSNQQDALVNGKKKEVCYIHKYTANGDKPLHESVLFTDTGQPAFVYLDTNDGKPKLVNYIERPDKILYPADNLDSQNPLPYKFASLQELEIYLELAKRETLDTLYQTVKSNLRHYVNVDDHYLVVMASDIILSYFQDKFPTMHYDIFVGDNGSGKNSAQLTISRLGYRVYYLVSASAPNYFTAYGNVEEGQVTIAEDEVGDIDKDYQKQKILKSGYASGGTVPKTDFPNGKRSQGLYNVYGIKWLAMEELPDSKKTRGIFDRSFIFNFIVGHVDYNIKDVIKNAGDPKFKPLYDELVHVHKLLFAFRLIHYNDVVPDIQINLENRNAELTKPSLRLFSSRGDAPVAVEEIRLALSKFIVEKNALKSNSIESKLCIAIIGLIRERNENPNSQDYEDLEDSAFTNEQIWGICKLVMDGTDIFGRSESFYSTDYGKVTHKKISSLIQSKFKAVPFKTSGVNSKRGWRFQKVVIDRIALQYANEIKEIKILSGIAAQPDNDKTASDATDASHYESPEGDFSENFVAGPGPNSVQEPPSEPVVEQLVNDRNLDHENIDTISNTNNINTNDNDDDNDNNTTAIPVNIYDNNYNITEINRNDNSGANLTNSRTSLSVACSRQTNQIKLYSNMPYRHLKCDASDASVAPYRKGNQNGKTKAEQVGFPNMSCLFCSYKDPLDIDLSLHYIEKHRQDLIRLPLGKGSIDDRADYAVELSKKRVSKLFEDEDENDDDDEFEIEEAE
jgi:hypothetical protein